MSKVVVSAHLEGTTIQIFMELIGYGPFQAQELKLGCMVPFFRLGQGSACIAITLVVPSAWSWYKIAPNPISEASVCTFERLSIVGVSQHWG